MSVNLQGGYSTCQLNKIFEAPVERLSSNSGITCRQVDKEEKYMIWDMDKKSMALNVSMSAAEQSQTTFL